MRSILHIVNPHGTRQNCMVPIWAELWARSVEINCVQDLGPMNTLYISASQLRDTHKFFVMSSGKRAKAQMPLDQQ